MKIKGKAYKYINRNTPKIIFIFSLFLILFYSKIIFAKGVVAGTDISNKVTVNYMINGEAQTPIESSPSGNSASGIGNGKSTDFKVDRKIDLLITSTGNAEVELGDTQAKLDFILQNEGNDTQEFLLITDSNITTDDYDISHCSAEITSVTGEALPSNRLLSSGNVLIEPDQQVKVSIKCDIPLSKEGQPIIAGQVSTLSLLAIAEKNADGSATRETAGADSFDKVDTVFVDGAGTDDLAYDAAYSSRGNYIISSNTALPKLNIEKTIIEVKDLQGGNNATSGSEISYRINVTTVGKGVINDVSITDVTPEDMTYKPASIKLDGIHLTDEADADKGNFGATLPNTATVNLGNVVAGSQYEIQISYVVD